MKNNKKIRVFSLAVLTSMLMPLATSCEPTSDTSISNLPESIYKDIDVESKDQTFTYDGNVKASHAMKASFLQELKSPTQTTERLRLDLMWSLLTLQVQTTPFCIRIRQLV